jgi:hypothetical protein
MATTQQHFKIRDSLLCIDDVTSPATTLRKGKIYTVQKFLGDEIVLEEIYGFSFRQERFIKSEIKFFLR